MDDNNLSFNKILVTGASGLLGSNICRVAVEQGRNVRGMVRKPADAEVLESLGIEPVMGDVTDIDSMRRAAAGVDGVVHSAALRSRLKPRAIQAELRRSRAS